jgi:hypothetical protein
MISAMIDSFCDVNRKGMSGLLSGVFLCCAECQSQSACILSR